MLSPLLSAPTSLPAGSDKCPDTKKRGSQRSRGSKMGGEEGPGDTWLSAVALGW